MSEHVFNTIAESNEFLGLPEPENPLFYLVTQQAEDENGTEVCFDEPFSYTGNFYTISLKHLISGSFIYGRTKYDCRNGSMIYTAPGQRVTLEGITVFGRRTSMCIHDDYLKGTEIRSKFQHAAFFSYTTNEALHLSPQEEAIVQGILDAIEKEYHNTQDELSKKIILSQLDSLLNYSERFFRRQFLNRKPLNNGLLYQFKEFFLEALESGRLKDEGLPTVDSIARFLGVSSRYLSDALKTETGMTSLQHLHQFLVEEAKNLLLMNEMTIEKVALQLGFSYPQHFSTFFKRKTGLTPSDFIKNPDLD